MSGVEVSGLSQTKDNFNQLSALVQTEIGRKALREAGWAMAGPMRAATYTTFTKRSGAIRRGIGVAVSAQPKDRKLVAAVNEYPQSIAGTSPAQALFRSHFKLKGHRPSKRQGGGGLRVDVAAFAFWWRYLEFGTGPRHAARTPRFLRTGGIAHTPKGQGRQLTAATRWQKSPSRGGVRSRSWIRPVYAAVGPAALTALRDSFLKLVDAAVSNMPKR